MSSFCQRYAVNARTRSKRAGTPSTTKSTVARTPGRFKLWIPICRRLIKKMRADASIHKTSGCLCHAFCWELSAEEWLYY